MSNYLSLLSCVIAICSNKPFIVNQDMSEYNMAIFKTYL